MKDEKYPLVSVVIPTYNRASLLLKAIGSVLAQSFSDLEVIIADDGSTDSTQEHISALQDTRIRYTRLPHSGHIGNVRNAGAFQARGKWIAFLDSDDTWVPRKLELQLAALGNSGEKWCYGNYELMNEEGSVYPVRVGNSEVIPGFIAESLLADKMGIAIGSIVVDKQLFDELGGFSPDPRLLLRGDAEFIFRLAASSEASVVSQTITRLMEHSGRVTHALEFPFEKSIIPYDVFIDTCRENKLRSIAKKRRAWLMAEAAVQRAAAGDRTMARKQLAKSFGRDSFRHWLSALYRVMKQPAGTRKPIPQPAT